MRGWVYIITNKAMPDLVKIGFSTKDPVLRAGELNHTGAPHPYEVVYDLLVFHPYQVEQQTHKHLADKREGKEWFRCSVAEAVAAIRKIAGDSIILDTNIEFIEDNITGTNQAIKENDFVVNLNTIRSLDYYKKHIIEEWKKKRGKI